MKLNLTNKTEESFGNLFPEIGKYHFEVIDIDATLDEFDAVIVHLEVLDGTVPDQRGRRLRERFFLSERARSRLEHFALVTGLVEGGQEVEVDFDDAVGRQFIGEVVDNEYEANDGEKKTHRQLGFAGMWSLDNPAVESVPRGVSQRSKSEISEDLDY